MLSKTLRFISVAILFAGSLTTARGQAAYAGLERRQIPFAVGFGMSNFDLDYGVDKNGERRMNGLTATLDTDLLPASGLLKGIGIEIEGRDLNYLRPSSFKRMRQSTILGGVVYTWPGSRRFRPMAKYLAGMGSIDFPPIGRYAHDTRMVTAPGVGLECKLFDGLSVRGDYEYQFWPKLFGPHSLNPNGFTITTVYDFKTRNRNRY